MRYETYSRTNPAFLSYSGVDVPWHYVVKLLPLVVLSALVTSAADLALVRSVVENEQVAAALASHGFTQEQVNQKLGQMSQQDLHQLARNLDQLQAAGLTRQEWIWIGVGALAALILVVALNQ